MTVDFGKDTSCTDSLRTGRFVTGARLVAEAAYRRITTPRGVLRGGEDEQNYGIDLAEFIGAQAGPSVKAMLPGVIRNELDKDERIDSVEVDVVEKRNPDGLVEYQISINAQTGAGPFVLKLAASAVTVSLLGIVTKEAA